MVGHGGLGWTIQGGLRRLGAGFLIRAAWAILRGQRRSLAEDAARVVARMDPPPRVEGLELVPASGPFLLVANHLNRADLWVGWVGAAITHAVASVRPANNREIHWIVTSEWRWFGPGGIEIPNPSTSLLFPRAARVWGLISLPARPGEVAGRARALRQALDYLRPRPGTRRGAEAVGIFPEGWASFALREALPGSGAFLHRISELGVPLLPVGAYLGGDRLGVRFGRPFFLVGGPEGKGRALDDWARREVMVAIGRLLPPQLWGRYAADIAAREG